MLNNVVIKILTPLRGILDGSFSFNLKSKIWFETSDTDPQFSLLNNQRMIDVNQEQLFVEFYKPAF